jgi:hypothetical protein
MMRHRGRKFLFFLPLALLAFAAFIVIGGQVVMSLWNWLLPPLFGFHTIVFWQALGLLLLTRILFGGFGMRGGGRYHMRERSRYRFGERLADRVGDRWDAMTPEERESFRQRVRDRCGFDPGTANEPKSV